MFMRFFETDTKEIKRFLFTHRKKLPTNVVNAQHFGSRKKKGHFSHGFFFKNKYRNLSIFLRL
jgi:hypothetical protein